MKIHIHLGAWVDDPGVRETCGVTRAVSGTAALSRRFGRVCKKPEPVSGKADPEAREAVLVEREKQGFVSLRMHSDPRNRAEGT